MFPKPRDGGVGHDFGDIMLVSAACITLRNGTLYLDAKAIDVAMLYDGWEKNLLDSEVVGKDCINADGDVVGVISKNKPKEILAIGDNFYDADDDIIIA